jgi:hypothetical protein
MSETYGAQAIAVDRDGESSWKRHRLLRMLPIVIPVNLVPGTTGASRQNPCEDSLAIRSWARLIPIDDVTVPTPNAPTWVT